jgi:hypothetical protein
VIQAAKIVFCENEHGAGDVTFPDLDELSAFDLKQHFIGKKGTGQLRKEAKAAGWGRINGGDYCPGCMEAEKELQ